MITVYTDGASRGNPGPGGYGVVLLSGKHRKELSEGFRKTTNNRMELLAVIKALEALKKRDMKVLIYSDSKYVVDAINQRWLDGWIKKGFKKVKNPDLWQRFLNIYRKFPPQQITFKWVKGHAGNTENERCDQLAVQSAEGDNLKVDVGYEQQAE
jgi:ribonuclease HI